MKNFKSLHGGTDASIPFTAAARRDTTHKPGGVAGPTPSTTSRTVPNRPLQDAERTQHWVTNVREGGV
jgi:hypothetical protein